ncbi:MAG: hypothetical protein JW900_13590 [Anaerolineae bacterium]|nr:hypothetical protein [Anaerolineae bacterium]
MRKILLLGLIGLVVGAVTGGLIGWFLWPVEYTNTTPAQLRQDYCTDYILMVAAAYQVEKDIAAAQDRLALLNPDAPAQEVVELAEQLIAEGGQLWDIRMLVHLANGMNAATPPMTPYLEGP